ncbi:MAG: hypothetical protein NWE98_10140 [Candidatus Bathyarchaeota archaeon]|nr:hypothetical protein [Candidatus Bathyarchaeota archaeon]
MTETITVSVNGEQLKLPVPHGFSLRKGCNDCRSEGKICATLNGSKVCCKPEFKQLEDGSFSLFEINPCSKYGDKKINI